MARDARRRAMARTHCDAQSDSASDTAFFPSKTQKNACRISGNAYYDRMKRVNAQMVMTNVGDENMKRSNRFAF